MDRRLEYHRKGWSFYRGIKELLLPVCLHPERQWDSIPLGLPTALDLELQHWSSWISAIAFWTQQQQPPLTQCVCACVRVCVHALECVSASKGHRLIFAFLLGSETLLFFVSAYSRLALELSQQVSCFCFLFPVGLLWGYRCVNYFIWLLYGLWRSELGRSGLARQSLYPPSHCHSQSWFFLMNLCMPLHSVLCLWRTLITTGTAAKQGEPRMGKGAPRKHFLVQSNNGVTWDLWVYIVIGFYILIHLHFISQPFYDFHFPWTPVSKIWEFWVSFLNTNPGSLLLKAFRRWASASKSH